ncbi:hypothetical protein C8R46DRAFT_1058162, partial [Mycena filopes]
MDSIPPLNFFVPISRVQVANLVCSHCLHKRDTLRKCAKCKRVAYCDEACQKQDWKAHKALCQRLRKMNQDILQKGFMEGLDLSFHLLEQSTRSIEFMDVNDDNSYGRFQSQFVTYEPKCRVCFRSPFQDTTRSFTACTGCELAWWCSAECKTRFADVHAKNCTSYRTVAAIDTVKIAYARARGDARALMIPTITPRTSYIPPSALNNWADYHRRIFPEFLPRAVPFTAREFQSAHPDATDAIRLLATESSSIPLTLLATLEEMVPDIATRQTLCIHIIGASEREMFSSAMMEEILHFLPRLKRVILVCVGPNVPPVPPRASPNLACDVCQGLGRSRLSVPYVGLYHDFAASAVYRMNPPDLVAGFNTGLGEVQVADWCASLEVILAGSVPAVFTAYSEQEVVRDIAVLRSLGAFIHQLPQENKWRGVIPSIDEVTEHQGESGRTHFTNHFTFMVRGKANGSASAVP